jgi:hypothetical protein
MSYHVVPVADSHPEQWNEIVKLSPEASLGHDLQFGDIISKGIWNYQNHSFLICDAMNSPVAIVPLWLDDQKLFRGVDHLRRLCSGWAPAGVLIRPHLPLEHISRICFEVFRHIDHVAQQLQADLLEYNSPPSQKPGTSLQDFGLEEHSTASFIIPLEGRSPETIWEGMEGRARTAIRKAEKLGVEVSWATSASDVHKFYQLHLETFRRTGLDPFPSDFFSKMFLHGWSRFALASYQGKTIAGVNIASYRDTSFYMSGASSAEHQETNATYLLQWAAIQDAQKRGVRFYEVGEDLSDSPNEKLKQISRFKRAFGGERWPACKGTKIYRTTHLAFWNKFLETYQQWKSALWGEI